MHASLGSLPAQNWSLCPQKLPSVCRCWVAPSLLGSLNRPQEAGIFELTILQLVWSLLQQLHLQKEKAEQALHKEPHSGCERACHLQGITTACCSQWPFARPFSRAKTHSCSYKSYVWLSSSFLLMVSGIHFDLGWGINVTFGSVLWCAAWQPLPASLLLLLTGLDEARLLLLLRGAVTSNICRSEKNLWGKQRLPGFCERQVWKRNSCPFISTTRTEGPNWNPFLLRSCS